MSILDPYGSPGIVLLEMTHLTGNFYLCSLSIDF